MTLWNSLLGENPIYLREAEWARGWSPRARGALAIALVVAGYLFAFYSLVFLPRGLQALDASYAPVCAEWAAGLLGIIFLHGAFADERRQKVDLFLVLTPLGRSEILLGKLLGRSSCMFYALFALLPLCILWSLMLKVGRAPIDPWAPVVHHGSYFNGAGRALFAILALAQVCGAFFLAAVLSLACAAACRSYWLALMASILTVAFALLVVFPPDKGISILRVAALGYVAPGVVLAWLSRQLDMLLCRRV